jgi:hypothetical protein
MNDLDVSSWCDSLARKALDERNRVQSSVCEQALRGVRY